MNFPVNSDKAADAVARLIEQSGPDVDYLRISKLIYLADREAIIQRGIPIVGGHYYSMQKGPVIGEVMDFVVCQNAPGWKELIAPRRGHILTLVGRTNYQTLTLPELEILDSVCARHEDLTTNELVAWCHANCPEYEDVSGSKRKPIELEAILEAAQKTPAQIKKLVDRARELSELDALLA